MDSVSDKINKKVTFSLEAFYPLLNWIFLAVLAFVSVILLHQLGVGEVSSILGYKIHIHFGKVDILPHTIDYWSNNRVLALFLLPPLILILVSALILGRMVLGSIGVTIWMCFLFWVAFFGILMGTTAMSISLFSSLPFNTALFQGFAVVNSWYELTAPWSFLLILLSVLINVGLGFLCSPVFFYLAPSDFMLREGRRYPRKIVVNSFIYTVLLVFIISLCLSFPAYCMFFIVMFLHACLWLPGLLYISNDSVLKRKSRIDNAEKRPNYYLIAATLMLILATRIFFS